jgi:hypothetical protein
MSQLNFVSELLKRCHILHITVMLNLLMLEHTIASFKHDGSIDKLYIRDFEGLRIDEYYLNSMGYSTDTIEFCK